MLLWFGPRRAGVDDPVWALISLVFVVEPEWAAATASVRARVLNAFLGCAVGALAALLLGGGFAALLASTLAATALAVPSRRTRATGGARRRFTSALRAASSA